MSKPNMLIPDSFDVLQAGRREVLELMAGGLSQDQILGRLCSILQAHTGCLSSILLLKGEQLFHGAAVGLPEPYLRAIDGASIGPFAGSCGTAAFRGEDVVVEDIEHDPLWKDYKDLALSHDLRACVSIVIRGREEILGTFALYHTQPGPFPEEVLEAADGFADLAAISILFQQGRTELAQREAHLKIILESEPDCVKIVASDGKLISMNAAGLAMLEADSEEEVKSMGLFSFMNAKDSAAFAKVHRRVMAGETCELTFQVRGLKGGKRWLHTKAVPLKQKDGTLNLLGLTRDVTDSVLAEEALRESQRQLQLAEDLALIMRNEVALNGQWLKVHPRFTALIGYSEAEMLAMSFQELTFPDDLPRDVELIQSLLDGKRDSYTVEKRYLRKDGSILWVDLNVSIIRDAAHRPLRFISYLKDITDKKASERAMVQTQKLESLGVLAGGIAHDFNNFLSAILGNVGLARIESSPASTASAFLDRIEGITLKCADLTKQMLAYSGRGRFDVKPMDLNALIEEMTYLLSITISKKVVIHEDLHKDLPMVEMDASQMQQVIMNLVINASEAIGERSGNVTLCTGLQFLDEDYIESTFQGQILRPGSYVTLTVSDNGCGMDANTLSKIFDPFFTTKFTGRGLGLAAMLGIVRGHKGGIKVYSEKGKGSSFKILLPASSQPKSEPISIAHDHAFKVEGLVLVVDDEESLRAVASETFANMGFSVIQAQDGREALAIFKERKDEIALMLVDLTMPHMDGEELFRAVKLIDPKVKVILSSGFNEQETIARFVGKGLAGFLEKPYRIDALMAKVREVLSQG